MSAAHRLSLLLLALPAQAFVASVAPLPSHRRVASSPTLFFDTLFPSKAPEVSWSASYKQKDIDALWNTIKQL